MIELLEALLIEATTSPNVTGNLVTGLRKAVEDVRTGSVKGKTFALAGVLPTLSRDEACCRIEAAGGAIVSAVSAKLDYLVAGSEAGSKLLKALDLGVPVIGEKQLQAMLPPPFDSQEEAEPVTTDPPYRVCIKAHETNVGSTVPVGHVVELEAGESLQQPECWVPCDKDGWVASSDIRPTGLTIEWRGGGQPVLSGWRPQRTPQFSFSTGHVDAIQKPSATNEMAEQMKRRVAPTRDDSKPTNPKDAAATDRVPLGLLSPIAKAHWALAQHCGRAKYGAWNWREAGVRASIYIDAIGRHADGYLSGETYDPADGTHHLGNVMACCAILLEAEAAGKLTDDRPPTLDMRPAYAEVQRRMADLTTKYADRNPKHWTRGWPQRTS